MICQRPAHKAEDFFGEFVGGKVEPGETKDRHSSRECQEELAITLDGARCSWMSSRIPGFDSSPDAVYATIVEGIPQKLEHNDIRWITVVIGSICVLSCGCGDSEEAKRCPLKPIINWCVMVFRRSSKQDGKVSAFVKRFLGERSYLSLLDPEAERGTG